MHTNQKDSGAILVNQPIENRSSVLSGYSKDIFKIQPLIKILSTLSKIRETCIESDSNFILVLLILIKNKIFYHKNILMHPRVIIKGYKNIKSDNILQIGLSNTKFVHKYDVTFLNIRGSLYFKSKYSIGRGCRFDIAEKATVIIGQNGYINANSTFIINHKLTIGNNCIISWNCQILDEDFHEISYSERISKPNEISIGNHVWIGCNVKIYKGTIIPDGCVIAAGSIVCGVFTEKNALIGGNPAKIIKQDISWK
jgi:acetyltransferase-like isoleucine patch superfamily enzyme